MSEIASRLFVKTGCPWCAAAVDYLDQHQINYTKINVTESSEAMDEMVRLSAQSKAPTLDWDGDILADFGIEELEPFLKEKGAL